MNFLPPGPIDQPNNPPGGWFSTPFPVAPINREPPKKPPPKKPSFPPVRYPGRKPVGSLPGFGHISNPPRNVVDVPGTPLDPPWHPPSGFPDPVDAFITWPHRIIDMWKRRKSKQGLRFRKRRRLVRRSSTVTRYLNRGTVYRRHAMPRRQKRRYMKRIRFVQRVINSDLAAKTLLFTAGGVASATSASAITSQGWMSFSMYGCEGQSTVVSGFTPSTGDNDMLNIYNDIASAPINSAQLMNVRGAVMDIQIQNESTTEPLFMDLYKIICRRDVALTTTVTTMPSLFARELGQQTVLPNTTALSINQWPVTLFDNSGFCRYFKILSKTRTQLDPGALVQLQLKDRKQRQFTREDVEALLYRRGWTQSYIVMFWGTPFGTATNYPSSSSISWTCSRRYRASVIQSNAIQAGRQQV